MNPIESKGVYSAVYSGTPVFEMVVNGVSLMRRRKDSYMNATQILKLANVDKGKRSRIIDKELILGDCEKVQGGYGKYQGTWVPFEKSLELAKRFNVAELLKPLFDLDVQSLDTEENIDVLPTKEQTMSLLRKQTLDTQHQQAAPSSANPLDNNNKHSGDEIHLRKRQKREESHAEDMDHERHKNILMSIFLSDNHDQPPDLLQCFNKPDFNIDMVIDEHGFTALHWATALAKINTVELLVSKGANIACTSYLGETPLMRCIMVTNSYDISCFPRVIELLKGSLLVLDNKKRSALHHAAITSGIQGRSRAAIYYMKHMLNVIAVHEQYRYLLDIQDSSGDTAINIAARLNCREIVDMLLSMGAVKDIPNNVGLAVDDYQPSVIEMERNHRSAENDSNNPLSNNSLYSKKQYNPSQRGKEIVATVQKIIDALDEEYGAQLVVKEQKLAKLQEELDTVTHNLEQTHKVLEERQAHSQRLSEARQKIKNIESSLKEGWDILQQVRKQAGKEELKKEELANFDVNEDIDALFGLDINIPEDLPEEKKKEEMKNQLKTLRATVKAYTDNDMDLQKEISEIQSQFSEKEMQCKRLIAACCNFPIEKIDDLVEPLTLAIESDPPDLDLARVIGFMDKIRRQGAYIEPNTANSLSTPSSDIPMSSHINESTS
ncbi:hypothetical protein BDB01DRAFT_848126 [Pilobolus umbonatus]|nr:hypothetical protein BDB01DRAFT_848126 [Pilobolus umbonatus]